MKDDFFKQYPYLCSTFSINKNTKIERKTVEAGELISPYRLDFMAKLLWIEAFEGRGDKAEADKLYEAHLQAFSSGTMVEPGKPEKKGLNRYYDSFSKICSVVRETECETIEYGDPIPVDGKYMAMDGSHRICAAVFYEKKVPIYQVFRAIPNKYDYLFFQNRYLGETDILKMVKKYVSLCECRLFLLDKAYANRRRIKKIYRECAPVYMRKIKSCECFVIIDRNWIERYTNPWVTEELLGTQFVEGTEAILECISDREAELLKRDSLYEYRKKWGMFCKKHLEFFKRRIKQLLGKPV